MRLQRVADERRLCQRDEALDDRERRGQELRRYDAARGRRPPRAEECDETRPGQREPARERQLGRAGRLAWCAAERMPLDHVRHGIARRSTAPSSSVIAAPVTATAAMPTTIIAGKRSSDD